ncbi:MAG: phosphoribosylanthranilate isomerase [Burkholderiaceae bacterium]
MRTRIKICGLTRPQDVDAAVEAGVDAIGLVFYVASPRFVDTETARQLVRRLPAWMASVGLFVNASREQILRTADAVGLSHLQLHGDETPADCQGFGRPVVKAIRLPAGSQGQGGLDGAALIKLTQPYEDCAAVLFDADSAGFGGSGQSFDWTCLQDADKTLNRAWVLSGGLSVDNVAEAIRQLRPPAVDVSSGVEQLVDGKPQKGIKDSVRIQAFVNAVRLADQDMEKR